MVIKKFIQSIVSQAISEMGFYSELKRLEKERDDAKKQALSQSRTVSNLQQDKRELMAALVKRVGKDNAKRILKYRDDGDLNNA